MSPQGFNARRATGNRPGRRNEHRVKEFKGEPDTFPGLTRRQSEVLSCVAQGKTNADVATLLGISRRTVDTLLSRTYRKLGVENRTAAVMRMIKFITLSVIYFMLESV
jgi:DNA-binding NarL/FixJ family response regulator